MPVMFSRHRSVASVSIQRFLLLLGLSLAGLSLSPTVLAECGGKVDCMAVSIDPAVLPVHGTPNTSAPLAFGNQAAGTSSAGKPILVRAVAGPAGTFATLTAITLTGANATDFSMPSTTCSVGSASLPQRNGTPCTVNLIFNPATTGAKNASLLVSTSAITRTIPLTGNSTLPAPVITSGLATSGSVGVPFAGYQIIASNNPTSFAAAPLPPGLTINASGAISGTPTSNGVINTTITATNATGSDNQTLVFTISATVPVITSAATASGDTGQAFSYQITATNSPMSYNALGLPPGISVNTATGLISGSPTAGGVFNASVTATNASGTANQGVTITVGLVLPTNQALSINVSVNTPMTIDLAAFIMGPAITGVRITAAPANGTAVASGTTVTYTPVNNYFGPDAFDYAAVNNDGESTPATVTIDVSGRPDPSADPVVRSLIRSQMETAKRFSRTQTANFQRRMESLHRNPQRSSSTDNKFTAVSRPVEPGSLLLGHLTTEPRRIGEHASSDIQSGQLPTSLLANFLSVANNGALDLSYNSNGANGASWLPEDTGFWVGGNVNFGRRDATSTSSGLTFSTDGISVGVDRRIDDQWVIGAGIGYARDETIIDADLSATDSRGSSISAYSSYHPTSSTFVDGLVGFGSIRHDMDRFVAVTNSFAHSRHKGRQFFGSVATGYEYRKDNILLSPYGRVDFAVDQLDQTTETGVGTNALTYFDQTLTTAQLSLGLRGESQHKTRLGWALPRFRIELKRDFESDRDTTIAFADQLAGPRFTVTPDGVSEHSLLTSVGSDFVFNNGLMLGIDYQLFNSFGPDHGQSFQFWLSKDLNGKKLLPAGLLSSNIFSDPVNISAGYTQDNNINRTINSENKLTSHSYTLDVSKAAIIPVNDNARIVIRGFLGGEKFRSLHDLDNYTGGLRGELQYRASGAFHAPTFGIFSSFSRDTYNDSDRSSTRYSQGITARQSLSDQIEVFGALSRNSRDAESDVFDLLGYSGRFNVDFSLGRYGIVYLGGEFRRGDTVTSTPNSDAFFDIADEVLSDDAYGSRDLLAYRYDAKTILVTLGYNWPLGPTDSIDFSWRRVQSKPTSAGSGVYAAEGSSAYYASQYSVAYLLRF